MSKAYGIENANIFVFILRLLKINSCDVLYFGLEIS